MLLHIDCLCYKSKSLVLVLAREQEMICQIKTFFQKQRLFCNKITSYPLVPHKLYFAVAYSSFVLVHLNVLRVLITTALLRSLYFPGALILSADFLKLILLVCMHLTSLTEPCNKNSNWSAVLRSLNNDSVTLPDVFFCCLRRKTGPDVEENKK